MSIAIQYPGNRALDESDALAGPSPGKSLQLGSWVPVCGCYRHLRRPSPRSASRPAARTGTLSTVRPIRRRSLPPVRLPSQFQPHRRDQQDQDGDGTLSLVQVVTT